MHYQATFAQMNNLRPGDVIIRSKSLFDIINHYVVYLGINHLGQEVYIENNYKNGVQAISTYEFGLTTSKAKLIRRFTGDDTQRYWAVQRAESLLHARYDLQRFNCESFANYVQFGTSFSTQVNLANSNFLSWVALNVATLHQKLIS